MVIWSHYMIVLIIIPNNIFLNLPITFTYHFNLLDYIPNISNLIYLLLEISFLLLHC